MNIEVETFRREEINPNPPDGIVARYTFPAYEKRIIAVANGREAMRLAREIHQEAHANGLGCFIIRRDDSGSGELLNLQF